MHYLFKKKDEDSDSLKLNYWHYCSVPLTSEALGSVSLIKTYLSFACLSLGLYSTKESDQLIYAEVLVNDNG